jgi:hypothetical protein
MAGMKLRCGNFDARVFWWRLTPGMVTGGARSDVSEHYR